MATCAQAGVIVGSILATIGCIGAIAQASAQSTETEFWPEGDAHIQFKSNMRVLSFTGLSKRPVIHFSNGMRPRGLVISSNTF